MPEAIQAGSRPSSSILSRIPSFVGVLRSKNLLAPSLADLPSSLYEGDDSADKINDYMAALEQLYGLDAGTSRMPLAIPFGTYASPAERPSYFAPDRSGDSIDHWFEPGGSASLGGFDGYSLQNAPSITALVPSPVSVSRQDGGFVGQITDYSWGDASDDSRYTPEADAWAGVVAAAVGRGHGPGSPSLALAGAETSPDTGPQRPPNEDKVASPGLDELADTVYSLIRERLAIEKERSFT
jgi:hypothetical protein